MVVGDKDWKDHGTYWLHKYPQRSIPWYRERSFRLTTTNFSPVVNPTFYKGHDDVLRNFSDRKEEKSLQDQIASNYGLIKEPHGRDWYCKKYKCKVREVGLAVPKWDNRIGTSLDGIIEGTDGIIEIKCPAALYAPIKKYLDAINKGWLPPSGYHQHIYDSHYDQIQGAMAITGKKWCDYIVFAADEQIFVERIFFDPAYWKNYLYPGICEFLTSHQDLFTSLQTKYLNY